MFKNTRKSLSKGNQAVPPSRHPPSGKGHASTATAEEQGKTRHSNGFDQFVHFLREQDGLSVLDFAGASQANISFITELGHRMYSEDFLLALESVFGSESSPETDLDPVRIDAFLKQVLDFPDNSFDGALVWDNLQFLRPPLLQEVVSRLQRILRPNACLLAFFHSDERTVMAPVYSYRISDPKTLLLLPRGTRKATQAFNNRGLERLFQHFQSIKFFLTRDALREVIVRR